MIIMKESIVNYIEMLSTVSINGHTLTRGSKYAVHKGGPFGDAYILIGSSMIMLDGIKPKDYIVTD